MRRDRPHFRNDTMNESTPTQCQASLQEVCLVPHRCSAMLSSMLSSICARLREVPVCVQVEYWCLIAVFHEANPKQKKNASNSCD